jgi:hypothetical protein
MTVTVALALVLLAVLDGAFSAFRSSVGRTGVIEHRRSDRLAARRGAALVVAMLVPVVLACLVDLAAHPSRMTVYARTGVAMLQVYGPYAALVLLALLSYTLLGWRQRYLAAAAILGPFTLIRPAVVVAGGAFGVHTSRDPLAAVLVGLAVVAVLAVEPVADRVWYCAARTAGPPTGVKRPVRRRHPVPPGVARRPR